MTTTPSSKISKKLLEGHDNHGITLLAKMVILVFFCYKKIEKIKPLPFKFEHGCQGLWAPLMKPSSWLAGSPTMDLTLKLPLSPKRA